jgi:hypothetical protein
MLTVHHKDWDRTNNDPSNLITLSRSCHPKEHFDVVDRNIKKICLVCGREFFPLKSKRNSQILCRRKECKTKYHLMQKRKPHELKLCIICGKEFTQKFPKHTCCSLECTKINNDRKKAERYIKLRDELKAKQIQYYADHKEERKAYIRAWQSRNAGKVKMYKRKQL